MPSAEFFRSDGPFPFRSKPGPGILRGKKPRRGLTCGSNFCYLFSFHFENDLPVTECLPLRAFFSLLFISIFNIFEADLQQEGRIL
jgi:hypothetical protein